MGVFLRDIADIWGYIGVYRAIDGYIGASRGFARRV